VELAAKELQALWQLEVQPLARQSSLSLLQPEPETRCVLAAEAHRLPAQRLQQQLPGRQAALQPLSLEFWGLPLPTASQPRGLSTLAVSAESLLLPADVQLSEA
jgi:hypothetical protein